MGSYVNPQGQSKEAWLNSNCSSGPLSAIRPWDAELYQENLPVCLVDNGPFTAAAIAYNEREFNDFNDPNDRRYKVWYIVSISRLMQVSDLSRYIKVGEVVRDEPITIESSSYTSNTIYSEGTAAQVTETAIDVLSTILVADAISDLFSNATDGIESILD